MDPNSTYLLKIKLLGNPKKARKDIKCFFVIRLYIDSDLTIYKDLVESILERYPPRYLEVAHVQYYDPFLKIYPEVTCDQQLVSIFEKHSRKRLCTCLLHIVIHLNHMSLSRSGIVMCIANLKTQNKTMMIIFATQYVRMSMLVLMRKIFI
uniref:Uncharacterized protein n=1 Tax=Hordeum vulgare subsp. vulgare TaxID=112509 RepID=A0A8I7B8P9_HORVV